MTPNYNAPLNSFGIEPLTPPRSLRVLHPRPRPTSQNNSPIHDQHVDRIEQSVPASLVKIVQGARPYFHWRREWDSNPRTPLRTPLEFQSSAFYPSSVIPPERIRKPGMVGMTGLGPARFSANDPKSFGSTDSPTRPNHFGRSNFGGSIFDDSTDNLVSNFFASNFS